MDAAHERLLAGAEACLPSAPPLRDWARRLTGGRPLGREDAGLTIDASFQLRGDARATARFSVNDRGDPRGFRDALQSLPFHPGLLSRFCAISAPGRVQTTVGVKWGEPGPERLTLYYEELWMVPDRGRAVASGLAKLAGSVPPESPALAVAIDTVPTDAEPAAFKAYVPRVDRPGAVSDSLPGSLEAFRKALPDHPQRGTRRMLYATRRSGGAVTGRKLIWVPEVRFGDPGATWEAVRSIRDRLRLPASRPASVLSELAQEGDLYPDLVSLDTDAAGVPAALTVYVAVLPGKNRLANSM